MENKSKVVMNQMTNPGEGSSFAAIGIGFCLSLHNMIRKRLSLFINKY